MADTLTGDPRNDLPILALQLFAAVDTYIDACADLPDDPPPILDPLVAAVNRFRGCKMYADSKGLRLAMTDAR